MSRLFPLPIYSFWKIAYKNGGVALKGLRNLPPWLIKTILFEPVRWIELAVFNRKVSRHKISKPPIFILGFYRSGTSYLHHFFAQDDRLGYHTIYQMVLPEIMLSTERFLSPVFEFICRVFNIQDHVHRKRLSFRFPGEEDGTMTTFLNPGGAQWGFFYPKKMSDYVHKYVLFDNISAPEFEKWKKDYVFLLKKISLASRSRQLVLKSPPNTARISTLLSMFPDAKFILIHRNPYEVYASNKRFWKVTHRIYALGGTQLPDLNGTILDSYARTMERYLKEKHLVPEGQLTELAYADFVNDPVESMRAVYKELGLDDFSYCEDKMKAYAELQKKFKILDHQLPEEERKLVSEKLEPFIRHWNYPLI